MKTRFAVVVKPEGVNTVGDARGGWTAERMLPYFLAPTIGVEGALVRPRPVHRLDALTSGLLVVAKTRLAATSLSEAFTVERVTKRYRAVLCGCGGARSTHWPMATMTRTTEPEPRR